MFNVRTWKLHRPGLAAPRALSVVVPALTTSVGQQDHNSVEIGESPGQPSCNIRLGTWLSMRLAVPCLVD
ncbi:uncharacterized protein B0I36DRAFT_315097 [Microdochium trichocladiopsis]|uniref:Uncharacterized protein n=1 Tax=Microdochium trichocladiopsis TaxID=1682393 RepID=A0A9P9BUY0_9PEZI|nr:uncharacterized protein B0I36DRAFT_315097 [Microdochium trichocladiopsis]KAH7037934.1 hypothetical protein B0I36DRAFT_315097 [Microdochium trichocladiopsis]